MAPRRAGDDEDRHGCREIDERRPEVRLDQDEQGRDRSEDEYAQRRPPLPDRALPLGDETGDRDDDKELAELGRLEGEEAEADHARRAVHRVADDGDDGDERQDAAQDVLPIAAVDVRVDERGDDENDTADARVEDMPVEVVVRVVCDVVPRHAGDSPQPDDDESRETGDEDPVEGAHDREQLRRVALAPSCSL